MRILIVHAHPVPGSFVGALHRLALETLREHGHDIDDLDLYLERFDPVLTTEERMNYYDPTFNRHPVEPYVRRLLAADALILCHPIWNFGWPAILKGYFDRVFLPEVSFRKRNGMLYPALERLRRIVTITTYGSRRHEAWLMGDPPRRNGTRMLRTVMTNGGKVDYLALYNMNNSTLQAREAFKCKVRRRLARL